MAELRELEIVITRPLAQAEKWRRELHRAGATTHSLPVLEIAPLSDPAEIQALKNRILALADYQKLIFVSQNAVQHAMEWVDRYWPQMPVGIQYFAVGSATASSARQWGLQVEAADQAMNSEALLGLPALQALEHEKILICRGVGGRSYLSEKLRQRGAQVDYCELYQRHMPNDAAQRFRQLLQLWEQAGKTERERVLSVHSGESLQNLCQLIDGIAPSGSALRLRETLLLVPGARVAELATQSGFRRIVVAANATDEAMTRALLDGI